MTARVILVDSPGLTSGRSVIAAFCSPRQGMDTARHIARSCLWTGSSAAGPAEPWPCHVPRAELTGMGMAQATTAHRDWLDEGKPEAPLAGGLPIVQLTACRRGGHRALPVPMLWW